MFSSEGKGCLDEESQELRTETHYIKTRQPELDAAMEKLEAALTCTVSCTEGVSAAVN